MSRFSRWLLRVSSGWWVLVLALVFVLFMALVLPVQARAAAARANGAESPDFSFIYSAEDLYSMADSYGPAGRSDYVRDRFTFDLAWPFVYAGFLAGAIGWFAARITPEGSPWRMANLVPVAAALTDLLENILASIVMLRYPTRTPVVDLLAPTATAIKWTLVSASFLLLLVFGLSWLARRLRPGFSMGDP